VVAPMLVAVSDRRIGGCYLLSAAALEGTNRKQAGSGLRSLQPQARRIAPRRARSVQRQPSTAPATACTALRLCQQPSAVLVAPRARSGCNWGSRALPEAIPAPAAAMRGLTPRSSADPLRRPPSGRSRPWLRLSFRGQPASTSTVRLARTLGLAWDRLRCSPIARTTENAPRPLGVAASQKAVLGAVLPHLVFGCSAGARSRGRAICVIQHCMLHTLAENSLLPAGVAHRQSCSVSAAACTSIGFQSVC